MYIKKELIVEAILYNAGNDKEIIDKFPDLTIDLKSTSEGNMIVKNPDDTYTVMNVSEFNKTYTKIEQIINNSYVNQEPLQDNTGIDEIEGIMKK